MTAMRKSAQIINSKMDLFSMPPTDITFTSSRHACVHPTYSVQQKDIPVEFTFIGDKLHWIDLSKSYVYIKLKIMQKDGTVLPEAAQVAPLNLILHTMWDDCELTINGTVLSRSNTHYAYRAYLDTQIFQGDITKENFMQQQLYKKEQNIGSFDENNISYEFLKGISQESKSFEVIGIPAESLFMQKKLLPPAMDLRLKFRRKSDQFVLKGPELATALIDFPYEMIIEEMTFHPHLNLLNPEIHSKHIKRMLKGERAKYIIPVSLVKSYTISPGSTSYITSDVFLQSVPQHLIVGLVDSAAFNGNFSKSPFNFEDFSLSSVTVTVEGIKSYSKKIDVDVSASRYLCGYHSLFTIIQDPQKTGNQISREDYLNGNFFLAFNLNEIIGKAENEIVPDGEGRVNMELIFKSGLTNATQLVVYGKFQSIVTIDHKGNVELEE